MPTGTYKRISSGMKGKEVFYASRNKGTIKGVEGRTPKSKALNK